MKITNAAGLPAPIVEAVKFSDYDKGGADYTISDLIRPPQINYLTKIHDEELCEDAADRIWALLGSSIHSILERSGDSSGRQEERIYLSCLGKVIGGKFDHLGVVNGVLTDYKVTSAYAIKAGDKPEWEKQLNYYWLLCERNGIPVSSLQIIAILRDWNRANKLRDQDYPQRNVVVVPVRLWPKQMIIDEMARDVQYNIDADAGNYRPCRDEERWAKLGQIALMKTGRKSAVKLFDTVDALMRWCDTSQLVDEFDKKKLKGGHYIEERPTRYPRCEDYCPVSAFCEQWTESNQ